MKRLTIMAPTVALAMLCAVAFAAKGGGTAAKKEKGTPFYGNLVCPAKMGGPTDPKFFVEYKDPATRTYGRIYMCCPNPCTEEINKDPAAAYKKAYLDREVKDKAGKVIVAKGEVQDLQNKACPVMGMKVTADDWLIYNGYKIHFCTSDCPKAFLQNPDKYLPKLGVKPTKMLKPETAGAAAGAPEKSAPAEK